MAEVVHQAIAGNSKNLRTKAQQRIKVALVFYPVLIKPQKTIIEG